MALNSESIVYFGGSHLKGHYYIQLKGKSSAGTLSGIYFQTYYISTTYGTGVCLRK
jgi:hypothetical protein